MAWGWYRCYVRWRHGARRLPRRLLLVFVCVPLLLALLVVFRLRTDSSSLGQRKYERALALREPPVHLAPPERDQRGQPLPVVDAKAAKSLAAPRGGKTKPKSPPAPPDIPAGIRPEVAALYQLFEFTCLRSGEVLPRSRINDDYCDCADGTDEPGTAACANGVFHCRGRDIASSRVGDGVCDCCDGSDEAGSPPPPFRQPEEVQRRLGRYQSPCPNTCQ